jgi:hypothetical protein
VFELLSSCRFAMNNVSKQHTSSLPCILKHPQLMDIFVRWVILKSASSCVWPKVKNDVERVLHFWRIASEMQLQWCASGLPIKMKSVGEASQAPALPVHPEHCKETNQRHGSAANQCDLNRSIIIQMTGRYERRELRISRALAAKDERALSTKRQRARDYFYFALSVHKAISRLFLLVFRLSRRRGGEGASLVGACL